VLPPLDASENMIVPTKRCHGMEWRNGMERCLHRNSAKHVRDHGITIINDERCMKRNEVYRAHNTLNKETVNTDDWIAGYYEATQKGKGVVMKARRLLVFVVVTRENERNKRARAGRGSGKLRVSR